MVVLLDLLKKSSDMKAKEGNETTFLVSLRILRKHSEALLLFHSRSESMPFIPGVLIIFYNEFVNSAARVVVRISF